MFALANPRPRSNSHTQPAICATEYYAGLMTPGIPAAPLSLARSFEAEYRSSDMYNERHEYLLSDSYSHSRVHSGAVSECRDGGSSSSTHCVATDPHDYKLDNGSTRYSNRLEEPPYVVGSSYPYSKRAEPPAMIDTFVHAGPRSAYPLEPDSAVTAPSEHSPNSEHCSPVRDAPFEAPRPRKQRREKPRIELAPNQPPTTQGKPRARVFVACLQWLVHQIVIC